MAPTHCDTVRCLEPWRMTLRAMAAAHRAVSGQASLRSRCRIEAAPQGLPRPLPHTRTGMREIPPPLRIPVASGCLPGFC